MATVWIRGEGLGGLCCSRLLQDAGVDIGTKALHRPKVPAIMLGETTQKLLRDVFRRDDLFTGFPRISKRVVLWGQQRRALVLPHSAVVAPEQELIDRIRTDIPQTEQADAGPPDWTVFASSPLPPPSAEYHFGARPASAYAVRLESASEGECCWIESLETGWLFLLPTGKSAGWLLSVGDSAESLLGTSRLIKEQICDLSLSSGAFPSHPRAGFPFCEAGWIACGTPALGFDPVCGEGAGNAVREAILASAAIRASLEAGDAPGVLAHYESRLLGGFKKHIGLCIDFYRSGGAGDWWIRQVNALDGGLSWCSQKLQDTLAPRYRLNGFRLERVQ